MFDDAKQDADLYFAYFDATIVGLGFVANVAALVVVPQCRFQMAGYRRFLISLTVGGLFTCIINALLLGHDFYSRSLISVNKFADNQPLSQLKLFQCIGNILRTLKLSCFLVSLLNLCGMSLDHYIGIMHPMRYHEIIGRWTSRLAVAAVWVCSLLIASIDLIINLVNNYIIGQPKKPKFGFMLLKTAPSSQAPVIDESIYLDIAKDLLGDQSRAGAKGQKQLSSFIKKLVKNMEKSDPDAMPLLSLPRPSIGAAAPPSLSADGLCSLFVSNKMWFEALIILMAVICFIFLVCCYGLIAGRVAKSARFIPHASQSNKLLVTTFIFIGTFVVCWFPFIINEIVLLFMVKSGNPSAAGNYATYIRNGKFLNSLLMCYPLIDPIVYAARISTVQDYVFRIFLKCVPNSVGLKEAFIRRRSRFSSVRATVTSSVNIR